MTEGLFSGGQPEGEAAFRELRAMGVKTIISVDGARPDVAAARRHGLRYVHLPHGYDGIPADRLKELAKAVRDLPGPIYVHCHHGQHRSPAAAAAACTLIGTLDAPDGLDVLRIAGTSPHYRGLYRSVEAAKRLDPAELDKLNVEFHEAVEIPPLAQAMVATERTHDNLKLIAASNWKTPPGHPDLDPAHEALLLKEQFAELARTDEVARKPRRFAELVNDSRDTAAQLETDLRARNHRRLGPTLDRVTNNCKTCHQQFRDVPLEEKAKR